ncbi:MAG: hypothetical protein GY757_20425 [bacterium]|nr:hypothetical protein [bacterium]
MKKYVIIVVALLFGFLLQLMSPPVASAQTSKKKRKNKTTQRIIKRITDLRVDAIYSDESSCILKGIDAFYMSNIKIDVSNHKTRGRGAPTESVVVLTYYDLMKEKLVSVEKAIPEMNAFPEKPWVLKGILVVDKPVLVKKNPGIRAEINVTTEHVTDHLKKNDSFRIKKCVVIEKKELKEKTTDKK